MGHIGRKGEDVARFQNVRLPGDGQLKTTFQYIYNLLVDV